MKIVSSMFLFQITRITHYKHNKNAWERVATKDEKSN